MDNLPCGADYKCLSIRCDFKTRSGLDIFHLNVRFSQKLHLGKISAKASDTDVHTLY